MDKNESKKRAYNQGIVVLFALAIFTGVEYGLAQVPEPSAVALSVIALIKAGIIIQYFMHVGRVAGEDSH